MNVQDQWMWLWQHSTDPERASDRYANLLGQWVIIFFFALQISLETKVILSSIERKECGHVTDWFLPWRMSKPGGWMSPSTMSCSVSGVVSRNLAKTSRPLLWTLLSTLCLRTALPIWSKLPPIWDKNLNEESKNWKLLSWQVKKSTCILSVFKDISYKTCKLYILFRNSPHRNTYTWFRYCGKAVRFVEVHGRWCLNEWLFNSPSQSPAHVEELPRHQRGAWRSTHGVEESKDWERR